MADSERPRFLLILDSVLLAALVVGGAWLSWSLFTAPGGARAVVWIGGHRAAWYPLDGATRIDSVQGALGPLVLEHGEGRIRVLQAPCPGHLCMRQGAVHRVGEKLVCVPSRIVVTIEGDEKTNGLDAVH